MNGRYTASLTELAKGGCLAANSNTFCCFSSSSSNVRGSGDAVGTRGSKCRSVSNPFRVLPSSRLGVSVTRWKHGKNIFLFIFLLLGLLYRSLFDLSCKVNSSKPIINAWPLKGTKHQIFSNRQIFLFSRWKYDVTFVASIPPLRVCEIKNREEKVLGV